MEYSSIQVTPSGMPMNILRIRADISKIPDTPSYKLFS